MSLNIKNEEIVAAVRELARRTGQTQTQAVGQAVAAELRHLDEPKDEADRTGAQQRTERLLARLREQISGDVSTLRNDAEQLYDERGLWR